MTNNEFYDNVKRVAKSKYGWSIYELQKHCDENVIRKSTFFSMFSKKSTPKLEYIAELGKALDISQGDLLEPNSNETHFSPLQIEILKTFDGYDEDTIRRAMLIVQGVLLANDDKK